MVKKFGFIEKEKSSFSKYDSSFIIKNFDPAQVSIKRKESCQESIFNNKYTGFMNNGRSQCQKPAMIS